jgi:hypothetical protein
MNTKTLTNAALVNSLEDSLILVGQQGGRESAGGCDLTLQ